MIVDSTNPRIMADNIRELAANSGGSDLPDVTAVDNGKVLGVVEGSWNKMDAPSGLDDYSTTERNLGIKWVDGKDVYEKTVAFTTGTSGSITTMPTVAENVDTLISISGYAGSYPLPAPYFDSNRVYIAAVLENDNSVIIYNEGTNYNSLNGHCILRYTKVTETRKRKTTKGEN